MSAEEQLAALKKAAEYFSNPGAWLGTDGNSCRFCGQSLPEVLPGILRHEADCPVVKLREALK